MARAPGTANGIRDPRAVTQPIEPGSLNLAHDVDDQDRTYWRLGDGLERRSDEVGLARGTRLREPLPDDREQHERDADTRDRSRARDGDWHRRNRRRECVNGGSRLRQETATSPPSG